VKDHNDDKENYECIGVENHDVDCLEDDGIKMISEISTSFYSAEYEPGDGYNQCHPWG